MDINKQIEEYMNGENEQEIVLENFIEIDTDNLQYAEIDEHKFQEGINSASYACGVITALVNTGVSMEDAVAYLLNERTAFHNESLTKIINAAEIEKAKLGYITEEKNRI